MTPSVAELAKLIDHSLLQPTLVEDDIRRGLEIGVRYQVATCCVQPYCVSLAAKMLAGTGVGVCSVMAFPHGNQTTRVKIEEAADCLVGGATELDMVINIGKALSGEWAYVEDEIRQVNETVIAGRAKLKVIFETGFLSDHHIVRLCRICSQVRVGWVKTGTGYGFVKQAGGEYHSTGATEHHVKLMRGHTDPAIGVKAAGGIRTLADLLRVRPWCTRIGASATQAILEEAKKLETAA